MKITKTRLKQIIKEELRETMIDEKVDLFLSDFCKDNDGEDPDFADVKAFFGDSHLSSLVWEEIRGIRAPCK